MWTAIPLSQLGTWDGNCIYKIKNGSRRCKLSAGGDTDIRRFGNRNELLAKISRGVPLTSQEKRELARGLCCLRWHSTKDIAREICQKWERMTATILVSLPPHQREIQRLQAENETLATQLQRAEAMKKLYYERWDCRGPEFQSLRAELNGLKTTLEETQQVEEISEDGNDSPTANFRIRRDGVLVKSSSSVPAVTTETSISESSRKHTIMSKFKTPTTKKIINDYSLQDSGYFAQASTPDRTFSTNNAYSASPTRASRASSFDSIIRVENLHKDFDHATLTPFSATTTKFEIAKFPLNGSSNINEPSLVSCNAAPALVSAASESTSKRDVRKIGEVSPPPASDLLEKLLKNFLGVIFFCWVGSLSFVQFTGLFIWISVIVWTQVKRGNLQEILQKYYYLENATGKNDAHDLGRIGMVRLSPAVQVDNKMMSTTSLRKARLWKIPGKFEFSFDAPLPTGVFSQ